MSRDGSGNYNLPAGNPVSPNTVVSSTWANSTLSDIGAALTQSLSKDGQTVPTANIPMGGNKITNLGAGTSGSDAARFDQTVGRLIGIQKFTASGTYTPTSGTTKIVVRGQGAGGGGGGAGPTAANQVSIGIGGAAGGIGEVLITSGFSGATVTIGAGGSTTSGGNGGAGGTTSFGSFMTLNGGAGGVITVGAAVSVGSGSTGGSASGTGIFAASGQNSSSGASSFAQGYAIGTQGANSLYGGGGSPGFGGVSVATIAAGSAATNYGAGGGGAMAANGSGSVAGGAGSGGVLIVYEYA